MTAGMYTLPSSITIHAGSYRRTARHRDHTYAAHHQCMMTRHKFPPTQLGYRRLCSSQLFCQSYSPIENSINVTLSGSQGSLMESCPIEKSINVTLSGSLSSLVERWPYLTVRQTSPTGRRASSTGSQTSFIGISDGNRRPRNAVRISWWRSWLYIDCLCLHIKNLRLADRRTEANGLFFYFFSSPDPLVSRAVVTAIKKGMKCTTNNIINSYVSLIYCFYNKTHIYNILSGSGVADLCIILITKLPPRPHAACSRRKKKKKNGELSKLRSSPARRYRSPFAVKLGSRMQTPALF